MTGGEGKTEPQGGVVAPVGGDRIFYGWIVVASAFSISSLYGVFLSYGVFFTLLMEEFNWTAIEVSVAPSLHATTFLISALLMGRLVDRYNPRVALAAGGVLMGLGLLLSGCIDALWQLYLFYGFIASLGVGAIFIPTSVTILRWFVRWKTMALGLYLAGVSAGALVMPVWLEYLIILSGWRLAFAIMGVTCWVVMAFGVKIFKDSPEVKGLRLHESAAGDVEKHSDWTISQVITSRGFRAIVSTYILFWLGAYIPLIHVVPFAVESSIPWEVGVAALSIIGAFSMAGRILMGAISDKVGKIPTLIMCLLLLSGSQLVLSFTPITSTLFIFSVAFGFAYGGCMPQFPAIVNDHFRTASIGVVFGLVEGLSFGVGGGIGPILGAYIFEALGSYQATFLVAASFSILSAILSLSLRRGPRT
ncbi:MAG: MFS transporter [Candidatus Bathyarchaeia archaeon]